MLARNVLFLSNMPDDHPWIRKYNNCFMIFCCGRGPWEDKCRETLQNLEKILGARFGFRSNTLCFLDNWNRLTSVGRAFGTWTKEGQDQPLLMMIGKYGSPQEVDDHFFTDPIPYLI